MKTMINLLGFSRNLGLAGLILVPKTIAHNHPTGRVHHLLLDISNAMNAEATTGATKKLDSPLSTPSIVKVYTQRDIQKFDSVYDLLKTAPGVHIEEGHLGRQYINIRSIQNQIYNNKVLLVINGIKLNDPTGPNFNLDAIPKESIKRLELVRGPGSVLYGSNAYSGVINIETFDGRGYESNFVNFALGSSGVFGTSVGYFERDEQNLHFFSLRVFSEDGTDRAKPGDYQYHSNQRNGFDNLLNGRGVVRSYPGQASDFRLDYDNVSFLGVSQFRDLKLSYGTYRVQRNASYQEDARIPFWGGIFERATPGSPFFRDPTLFNIPMSFHEPGRVRSENQIRQNWLGLEYTHRFSDKTRVKTLFKTSDSSERVREFDLYLFNLDSDSKAHEFEVQAEKQVNDRLNLILGYNQENISFGQKTFGSNVNWASSVFTQTPLPSNEFFSLIPGSLRMEGIYIQGIFKASDKISILAANRRNSHEIVGNGYTPKYAVTFALNEDEFLKVIWGKGFRYPNPFELFSNIPTVAFRGSVQLREECIESWEYNWSKSMKRGDRQISVTRYDMRLTNLLRASVNTYTNRSGVIHSSGWELEWNEKINHKLQWYTNLNFMNYQDIATAANPMPGTMNFNGSLGLDYKIRDNLRLYTTTRYLGERVDDLGIIPANQPPATIHDFGLVYKHSRSRELRLDVLNLLDEDYRTLNYTVSNHKMLTPPRGRRIQISYKIGF
ncbi:MAG: TonB-dependent receptor [Candidatus Cloacimonetes bacterium]|nr:TonB-dependent receptor [Candidatus Cloacimonadota bacterium]